MIQEKDFLYRVPVKTAPITTPRGQIRNPEILVDIEDGEFMHGNILDANSTNKLVNQSVKEAVDNKLNESGYVTKDLLEAETTRATEQENSLKTLIDAETSARTKGDEDLSSKIKAEQTRAEGKEKEISDKLAIVDGDSNTEGSFRKAIADVIAAAPEDLDTLKEIADKLAGNDDLHTALNQAITEKADASALANEVARATGAESGLQAAIATKADATALSNYVLTTALNKQVDTLNTAISAKQDKGNYIAYSSKDNNGYTIDNDINFVGNNTTNKTKLGAGFMTVYYKDSVTNYSSNGINSSSFNNCLATSDGTFKPISDFVLKTELPTVNIKTSQLTNDSNFIAADFVDEDGYYLYNGLNFGLKNNGVLTINGYSIRSDVGKGFILDDTGIKFNGKTSTDIPTAGGDFIDISNYATRDFVTAGLLAKQNKIPVNTIDITGIETADVTKLRTIVINLINTLNSSGLIKITYDVEIKLGLNEA